MTLKELQEKLQAKQKALHDIFEAAKTEKGEYDFAKVKHADIDNLPNTTAKLDKIHSLEKELNDLFDETEKLAKAEGDWQRVQDRIKTPVTPVPQPSGKTWAKSLGELIVGSKEYTRHFQEQRSKGGIVFNFNEMYPSDVLAKSAEFKTLFSTTAGWAPESLRLPGFVEGVTRPIQLLDIIPLGRTSFEQIVYMEETTRTHAATEIAEGGTFPEGTFSPTEQTSPVRKIATSIPVTDEQLEDVAQAESYLNSRVVFGLRQRLDNQVLLGTGVAPLLLGIKNNGSIQTQAKGADPVPDAFFKAMVLVATVGRAMPTHLIMHWTDWQGVRLLRTADGIYIWGNPSEAGPERMWGLPVVKQDADAAGTGWVGSFMPTWISLFERRGIDVQIGFVGTQFAEGKRTIRADMRMAFVLFRPAAFSAVTGL